MTNVNAGILQVGSNSTTGTLGSNAAVTIATSSTLRTSRSNTIDLGQAISGSGCGTGEQHLHRHHPPHR